MIVSRTHRFCFIHIPKSAGTSVRKAFGHLNEWALASQPWRRHHERLGLLDYAHIPLFTLKNYFPDTFAEIQSYWKVAVVRDPFERFPSSVFESLRTIGSLPASNTNAREVERAIYQSMDYLSGTPTIPHLLPANHIHFQRQCDYIFIDSKLAVDKLYVTNEMHEMFITVSKYIGSPAELHFDASPSARINPSLVYRNEFTRSLIAAVRPMIGPFRKLIPNAVQSGLRKRFLVERKGGWQHLFRRADIVDFINDYYREDVQLYEALISNSSVDLR